MPYRRADGKGYVLAPELFRRLVGERGVGPDKVVVLPPLGEQDHPTVHGTGLLVDHNKHFFVVSADHVFEPLKEDRSLYFYYDEGMKRNIGGKGLMTNAPNGDRNQDNLDIGVIRLEGEMLPTYQASSIHSLPLSVLKPRALPHQNKQYLAIGYPTTKAPTNTVKKQFTTRGQVVVAASCPTSTYDKLELAPEDNLILPFSKRKVIGLDGRRQMAPDPHGMSGAPVWLIYDELDKGQSPQKYILAFLIEYWDDHNVLVAPMPVSLST